MLEAMAECAMAGACRTRCNGGTHGAGQTIAREMLVVADHNAYHIGELAIMRQVMDTWGANH